jgi:hypothetical protein
LFLCCFCSVVAAFICMFCFFMTYSTSYCCHYEPGSSVGIAAVYGLTIGWSRFDSRRGLGIFLLTTAVSRAAPGPTQPPIQWVSGTFSLVVNLPGREDDLSTPYTAEVKECAGPYLHSPNTYSWHGA